MLTVFSDSAVPDSAQWSRRQFLQIGAGGLGGLAWPEISAARTGTAGLPAYVKDKSVVFLFLCGGASQFETFDPKMAAPVEHRSMTGETKTTIPGITFGGSFPRLAQLARRLVVVRSFTRQNQFDETHEGAILKSLKADVPSGVSMGAMSARLRGMAHPRTSLPTYIQLADPVEGGEYEEQRMRFYAGTAPGRAGLGYAPFDPSRSGALNDVMTLKLPVDRFSDRRQVLASLDNLERRLDGNGTLAGYAAQQQQAFDVILGKCREAFDVSKENQKLVERYDTSGIIVGYGKGSRAKDTKYHPSPLGQHLLLARRLCEAGAGLVCINSPFWDSHGEDPFPDIAHTYEREARAADQAVSAFLEDVAERGLSDKILLVIATEFGRTPKINQKGGRDHWAKLCPLVLAGGGWKMGQVIGQSTAKGDLPDSNPVTPQNLMATIMHTLFDKAQLRVAENAPRDLAQIIENADPIPGLE